ncbi:MAG TPA: 4Fe-4S dicluster domain-containing protein [Tepidisphaeraceae bacterium]|jgi:ferredoxin-type protein NapG
MAGEPPLHRRQFFRQGLSELLKPLAKALEPVERTLNEFDRLSRPTPAAAPASAAAKDDLWLRPPGALREKEFLDTCSRCGDCVSVCPAEAIHISPAAGQGAPFIDADSRACVACDGLYCMSACPTGALVPTPLVQIKMGTAVWRQHLCTRTTLNDECRRCVDVCPIGTAAIELVNDQIEVKPLGCIGCGMCQQDCPTTPRAITVIPKAARER